MRKKHPAVWLLYATALAIALYFMVRNLVTRDLAVAWYAFLAAVSLCVPQLFALIFDLVLTPAMEGTAVAFIFSCGVLGEVMRFYDRFAPWDILLHFVSGFLFCAFGFAVWELRDGGGRALAGFSFALSAGVLWEFIEYFSDRVFGTDMQKDTVLASLSSRLLSPEGGVAHLTDIDRVLIDNTQLAGYLDIGLYDTMNDMLAGAAGALAFLVLYGIDLRRDTRLSRTFIPYFRYQK